MIGKSRFPNFNLLCLIVCTSASFRVLLFNILELLKFDLIWFLPLMSAIKIRN